MAARKGRHLPGLMKFRLGILLALLTLILDQVTKLWALAALKGTVPLLGSFLSLRLVRNPGAAFSLGSSSTIVLTIVSAVVSVLLVIALRRCRSTPWAVVLGVILGGAVGNLIDRLFRAPGTGRGHVIDFINYNDWFIGNVADIALVGGVIALIAFEFLGLSFSGAPAEETAGERTEGVVEPAGEAPAEPGSGTAGEKGAAKAAER